MHFPENDMAVASPHRAAAEKYNSDNDYILLNLHQVTLTSSPNSRRSFCQCSHPESSTLVFLRHNKI